MKIKVIPHNQQAYDTCGDYRLEDGEWVFYVSRLSKRRYQALVACHEIIEASLCWLLGIDWDEITSFDIEYEKCRKEGDLSEPGNDRRAPYFWQHQIATFFERILAFFLFVNWKNYEHDINKLVY